MSSSFVIAAPKSGSGKTTFSLGLMRALHDKGLDVRPFKCGPDYIDTHFHTMASGCESVNLDIFMSSKEHVKDLFSKYSTVNGVNIIEGAMGMFDGYDKMEGSCADIAMTLDLPVILIVDATSTSYSVAAMIYGFKNFNPRIKIAGVVFNRVASANHYSFLLDACKDAGVECFGYIGRDNNLQTPSRHLGLTLTGASEMNLFIESSAEKVKQTVDIDRILEVTKSKFTRKDFGKISENNNLPSLKIAVAHDEAFNFIYRANIDRLKDSKSYRVEIQYFSPLNDSMLPSADIVYLPGGYPELYVRKLCGNHTMRQSIKEYVENGGKLLAECGGMIYLGEEIDGEKMCGVFPVKVTMKDARLTLGYRTVVIDNLTFRGHEFHYSRVTDDGGLKSVARQSNAKGNEVATPIYRYKNCFAGYTHLYWADKDILKLWL